MVISAPEPKSNFVRILSVVAGVISLIMAATYCGIYTDMYRDAIDANSKYNSLPNITNEASYYDTCGIGEPAKDL